MKKLFLTILMIAVMQGACAAHPWELIEDTYTVHAGDTLECIAQKYMKKNTYGPREIHEFMEGILELNEKESAQDIRAGEKIRINYWIRK